MRTMLARASISVFLAAGMLAAAQDSCEAQGSGRVGPPLEAVKTFGDDFRLVGIGVSAKGRVFATAPSSDVRSHFSMVEVDPKTGAITPYPDAAWNKFNEQGDGRSEWISVQALWVDRLDHLWALDSSLSKVDQRRLPPKLVEFDLSSNRVIRQYDFNGVVSAKDSLNDVRVDTVHDYAYLTNAGNEGSLVVLDLKTGVARQVLVGDRSTFADPSQHLMIGNEVALRPDGSVRATQADGIALSPDAQWLYYRPLTDHNYWRVPTSALRDAKLSEAELAGKVDYLGSAALSGGLIMDRNGTLYAGDLEHRTVVALTLTADRKLHSRIFVRDPSKLSWADGFAISGGYLYIADSHLWEVAFKNSLPRSGPFTIFKAKLPH
ncbi:L-dopachrome tautomerase-related protein [Bradyrhizobium sp. LTSPM299]|uniref:L-dopachrome tautomerase-related protein n=1 Tax=Bradyrhizobium sp. LTSPM299 TaxID=1619233 RepID=UPI0018CE9FB9|nr:L-dopachrome tautomerase-related protein [Bradyrhizobium sp. LTSPM299]